MALNKIMSPIGFKLSDVLDNDQLWANSKTRCWYSLSQWQDIQPGAIWAWFRRQNHVKINTKHSVEAQRFCWLLLIYQFKRGAGKERGNKRILLRSAAEIMNWSDWPNSQQESERKGELLLSALHLLGGVPIPGVVVILAVLLSPEPADFTIFLEVLRSVLQSVLGESVSFFFVGGWWWIVVSIRLWGRVSGCCCCRWWGCK